ncbi:MAG TPA: heavy metal translocating P-type ATPase, partial [Thiobacillus sp.]|nr:heavy metal translocating P-type ATPase [Thiobacillus sp.]
MSAHSSHLHEESDTGHAGHLHDGGDSEHGTHGHHAHMAADFRKRFWIALALTLPILGLSPMLQKLVGLREAIRFSGDLY